jgi:hypothetical protein
MLSVQGMNKLKFLLTTLSRLIKKTNFLKPAMSLLASQVGLCFSESVSNTIAMDGIRMSSYKGTEPPSRIDLVF